MKALKAIIWTCSDPVQADLLPADQANIKTFHWPLTELKPISIQKLPDKPDCVIVTSKFAVERICCDDAFESLRKTKVPFITFGEKTYQCLVDQGLHAQLIKADGAKGMCEQLVKGPKANAWYVASDRPAFDVAGYLVDKGWHASHVKAYRSQQRSMKNLISMIPSGIRPTSAIVCFANPLAIDALSNLKAKLLSEFDLREDDLSYLAIGRTTRDHCEKILGLCEMSPQKDFNSLYLKALTLITRS